MEALTVQPVHALTPRCDVLVSMHQGKWYPLDVSLTHFLDVFQCQRARSEVTRIGIVLTTLDKETVEVLVTDDSLATNNGMSFVFNLL